MASSRMCHIDRATAWCQLLSPELQSHMVCTTGFAEAQIVLAMEDCTVIFPHHLALSISSFGGSTGFAPASERI